MERTRAQRNLIALLIGALIIAPFAIHDAYNKQGIFGWFSNVDSKKKKMQAFSFSGGPRISANSTLVADLRGQWLFATGDDPARSSVDYDATGWLYLNAPGKWENQGFWGNNGYAWYRRTFDVGEEDLEKNLVMDLGRIDDVDEAFVNGVRVGGLGQFPPNYATAYNRERIYSIPAGVLKAGQNLVAVRVYDAEEEGGIVAGELGVYALDLPRPLVDLQGEWEFRLANSDSAFSKLTVPIAWEDQGFADYDGMAFYRKTFGPVDVEDNVPLVLMLGKIDDTDEVILNGKVIGRTGTLNYTDRKTNPKYYLVDRRYEFSSSLLKDENLLQVRVHDNGGEGGIYQGPVAIVTKQALQEYDQ